MWSITKLSSVLVLGLLLLQYADAKRSCGYELGGMVRPHRIDDVKCLIRYASSQNLCVRVIGSGHSPGFNVYPEQATFDDQYQYALNTIQHVNYDEERFILLQLGEIDQIDIDESKQIVSVGAGIRFDQLIPVLKQKGFALSQITGVIETTVGGYVSTASDGSSLRYSLMNDVMGFSLVDGMGGLHHLNRDNEAFYAIASNGLMGVIVEVQFKIEPLYNVRLLQTTTHSLTPRNYPQVDTEKDYWKIVCTWGQYECEKAVYDRTDQMIDSQPPTLLTDGEESSIMLGSLRLEHRHKNADSIASFLSVARSEITSQPFQTFLRAVAVLANHGQRTTRTMEFLGARLFYRTAFPSGSVRGTFSYEGIAVDVPISHRVMQMTQININYPLSQRQLAESVIMSLHQTDAPFSLMNEIMIRAPSPFWQSPAYTTGTDVWANGTIAHMFCWSAIGDASRSREIVAALITQLIAANVQIRFHTGKLLPTTLNLSPRVLNSIRLNMPKRLEIGKLRTSMDPNNVFLTQFWKDYYKEAFD